MIHSTIGWIPPRVSCPPCCPALLARAPLTPDKVEFAWRTVVGGAMARATRVQLLDSGTHARAGRTIRTGGARWKARVPVILPRLTPLLGPDAVRKLVLGPD